MKHTQSASVPVRGPRGLLFAHASEAELARILEFYRVDWQYEPRTFPLRWNAAGDAVESLTPDFFLPAQGVYLELTTQKPRLMAKKHRKVRRFQELYPHLSLRLIHGRDFHQLMWKYAGK